MLVVTEIKKRIDEADLLYRERKPLRELFVLPSWLSLSAVSLNKGFSSDFEAAEKRLISSSLASMLRPPNAVQLTAALSMPRVLVLKCFT